MPVRTFSLNCLKALIDAPPIAPARWHCFSQTTGSRPLPSRGVPCSERQPWRAVLKSASQTVNCFLQCRETIKCRTQDSVGQFPEQFFGIIIRRRSARGASLLLDSLYYSGFRAFEAETVRSGQQVQHSGAIMFKHGTPLCCRAGPLSFLRTGGDASAYPGEKFLSFFMCAHVFPGENPSFYGATRYRVQVPVPKLS